MELITKRVEDQILYLEMRGRIDSTNASQAEEAIAAIRQAEPGLQTVLDAEHLEYISSAGLRVLLRLRKEMKSLRIINVNSEVYEILEMTGFTDMLTVEKAFRRLSLEGCELIAQGANGKVYRYDEETIVKVYYNGTDLEEIRKEKDLCRKVFVKGINTAIPYDVVRVDAYYGYVAEMLSAKSIAKLIRANPDGLDAYMTVFTDMLKKIHETEVFPGEMPSMKEVGVDWIRFLEPYLPADQWSKLIRMAEALPEPLYMIHGDYHANNVMLQNGEPLLIDMDTVAFGHPVFEFASIYLGFVGFAEQDPNVSMEFHGLPNATTKKMWELTLEKYFDNDREKIEDVRKKAMIVGYARLMRRTIRRNGFNTPDGLSRIELCKQHLAELIPVVDSLEF